MKNPSALNRLLLSAAALLAGWLTVGDASAQDTPTTTWTGATSTAWTLPANWTNSNPTAATVAEFNQTFTNNPIGANIADGIWVTDGTNSTVSITGIGSSPYTVLTGTATINGIANVGILLDGTNNNNLSFLSNTVLSLSNSTSFLVNNSATLTLYKEDLNGKVLTLGGTAGGTIVASQGFGITASTGGSVVVNTAGTVSITAASSFTGGLTIQAGLVKASSITALGTGALTLGNTTGTAAATFLGNVTGIFATPVILATNPNAGALTLGNGGTAIGATFSGGVTGTNDLTINEAGTSAKVSFTNTAINNAGAINHVGAGTSQSLISGGVGANVNAVNQNSATSSLLIGTTALTVNTGGTTLSENTSGTGLLAVNGGVNGTGALILDNNGSTASGITISGTVAVNNAGTITNAGTGTGSVAISAPIGANVTAIIQNSGSSTLSTTGAITIGAGTAFTNNSSSATTLLTIGSAVTGSATAGNFSTLTLNGTNTGLNTVTGVIADGAAGGKVNVTKSDAGTWVLSGANTFTGNLTLSSGILRATTSTGALGAGTLTLAGGELQLVNATALNFARNTTVTANTQITSDTPAGTAGVAFTLGTLSIGAQTLTIAKGPNATGTGSVTFGATTLTGSPTFSIGTAAQLNLNSTVALGANTLTIDGAGAFNPSGVISGTGGLTLAPTYTGIMTISNTANSYSGGSVLNGGQVNFGVTGVFGTGLLTLAGTTLNMNGNDTTLTNALAITGSTVFQVATGHFLSFTGAGTISNSPTLTFINGNGTTFSNALTLNSDVTLAGTQPTGFSGGFITNGDRQINTTNTGSTGITISSGGVAGSPGGLSGTGNITLNDNSTGQLKVTGPVNNTGSITNSGTGTGLVTISGVIGTNVTSVTENSATSTLALTGINTFTGGLRIPSGTVLLGAAAAAGTGQIVLGNTSGSADASLLTNSGFTAANSILVQAGNTGLITIGQATANGSAFSGTVTLNKDVNLSSFQADLSFTNATSEFTGPGGITVTNQGLQVSSSGQAFGIGGGRVVLSGPSTYAGNTRIFSGTLATATGTPNTALGSSTNAVLLGDTSGIQSAQLSLAGGGTLSRAITVQAGNAGLSSLNSSVGTFSGPISLLKSLYVFGSGPTTVSGVISKGAGALGAVSVTIAGARGVRSVFSGTNSNTYDGGTTVGVGELDANTAGSLGTGNVVVEGGILHLGSATALAANKMVRIGSLGELTIGVATLTPAYINSIIDGTSSGAIGIGNGVTYSSVLNLSAFGNGLMALGTDISGGGTYSATSLGVNSDGNYRLGYGGVGNSLTISNAVLSDGTKPASVIVGGQIGNLATETNGGNGGPTLAGNIILNTVNTYTAGTVVNSQSLLQGAQPASGAAAGSSPFGSGTIALHNAILQLNSSGTANTFSTAVSAITFDGGSSVKVGESSTGTNTLAAGTLTRVANGTLLLGASAGTLGTNAVLTAGGITTTAVAINSSGGTANMAPAYFFDSSGNYVSYNAGVGFAPITTSLTTVTSGNAQTNAFVKTTANDTIGAASSIYALSLGGNLTSSSGGTLVLTITGSGIQTPVSGTLGATIGGSTSVGISLDFAGHEAIFAVGGNGQNQNGTLTIQNALTGTGGNGLTKSGQGGLVLNSNANSFTGPITINQGDLVFSNDLQLGSVAGASLSNGVTLNGGGLQPNANTSLNVNRTLTLGYNGGSVVVGGTTFSILGPVTGTGAFINFTSNNTNTGTATAQATLANVGNDFVAPIFVGATTFDTGRMTLLFSDNAQLGNVANTVTLVGGNSILQYTGATASIGRGIIFQDQGGGFDVVNSNTVLTESGAFSGSGLFYKNGLGTLALTGATNSFSGNVVVTAGVLNVSNANALGLSTAPVAGNSGVSGGPAFVQSGGALEVQGGIALEGTGGKTLYLNGSGVTTAGALRNVSGNNSDTGAVILQTNTSIGVDAAGDTLSLTGGVRGLGALTKVGAGTLQLSGTNTYTGATNVNVGTLLVTGMITATNGVNVASGATLNEQNVGTLVTSTNSFTMAGASPALSQQIGRSTPGTTAAGDLSTQVNVTGAVTVTGALTLTTLAGANSTVGDVFYLIINDGADAVNGMFTTVNGSAAAEGSFFQIDGSTYEITYQANYEADLFTGGNDIAVEAMDVVPESRDWAMMLGGLGVLLCLQQLRRRSRASRVV